MKKEKNWHNEGQIDRKKSKKDSNWDIIRTGGSSPNYKPPKDTNNREKYKKGWFGK